MASRDPSQPFFTLWFTSVAHRKNGMRYGVSLCDLMKESTARGSSVLPQTYAILSPRHIPMKGLCRINRSWGSTSLVSSFLLSFQKTRRRCWGAAAELHECNAVMANILVSVLVWPDAYLSLGIKAITDNIIR